ncbi:hypothetical protein HF086_015338 [Spodoptera exigua]|uniref:Uncharacterized protein n=1 Tax=Spodoptera exigua TaxID=7107 RepID=A0A922M0V6_SPOEX|nr:hypothetical protein HF086_015338 [Spodoptera exigua]
MGIIQSVICSVTFCMERVLTWTCCAFLLMLLMFCIVMLMVYGISVGYHYAQKELASFAIYFFDRPPKEPELSPNEREMARKLIGRFRRSRNNTTPFLKPLKPFNSTYLKTTPLTT